MTHNSDYKVKDLILGSSVVVRVTLLQHPPDIEAAAKPVKPHLWLPRKYPTAHLRMNDNDAPPL